MADPIYEVKVKEDQSQTPPTPPSPGLTEEQISTLIDTKSQEKADEIASAKVDKLKEELAESLSGGKQSRYGKSGPESWDKYQDDTKEMTLKEAEALIDRKLASERKAEDDRKKQTQKQVEDTQKAEYARMSAEWNEAVQDGVLPDISKAVKDKLNAGTTYDNLTDEEKRDPGLKAYNEVRLLHVQLTKEGKSNSFYRTASQIYRKQPAGARAPVMGGAIASPGQDQGDEYSYDEIAKNRKAKFKF